MSLSKRIVLALPLAIVSAAVPAGCGAEEKGVALSPQQLDEAQKLRAASLKGEGQGAAPKTSPKARRISDRR